MKYLSPVLVVALILAAFAAWFEHRRQRDASEHGRTLQTKLDQTTANLRRLEAAASTDKKEAERLRQDAEKARAAAKGEAEKIISVAKAQAGKILKEAEGHRRREESRLHEVFPELRPFAHGTNVVESTKLPYVESFEVTGSRIRVRLANKGTGHVRPDYRVVFLNKYGFVTGSYGDMWAIQTLKPEEVYIDEGTVRMGFNGAKYYNVDGSR